MRQMKLDPLFRMRIPKEYTDTLKWNVGDTITMTVVGSRIIIANEPLIQICSTCKEVFTSHYAYCPFCGAELFTVKEV